MNNDYELTNTTQSIHKIHISVFICTMTKNPQIDTKNRKWRADMPRKYKFLPFSSSMIGKHTVMTSVLVGEIRTQSRSEKSKSNVVKDFTFPCVFRNRCFMYQITYYMAKGSWNNNRTHRIGNNGNRFIILKHTFK